jgi:hypothetical protein
LAWSLAKPPERDFQSGSNGDGSTLIRERRTEGLSYRRTWRQPGQTVASGGSDDRVEAELVGFSYPTVRVTDVTKVTGEAELPETGERLAAGTAGGLIALR